MEANLTIFSHKISYGETERQRKTAKRGTFFLTSKMKTFKKQKVLLVIGKML